MLVVDLAIGVGGVKGLAIDEAVSMGADVAVGFFRLFLW